MPDKMAASGVEVDSPVKQCIIVLEKKIRNLEKRKGKLDSYRKALEEGELNKDQKEAIAKYDVVLQNIDFAKELLKQFVDISFDTEKAQKKLAKREKVERHQQESLRLQDVLKLNGVLNALGNDAVREAFQEGKHTSLVLKDDHLQLLDDTYQILFPTRDAENLEKSFPDQVNTASEHLVSYLDRQDKKVLSTTYKDLHELIDRINDCGYFDKSTKTEAEVQQLTESVSEVEQYEESVTAEEEVTEESPEPVEPTNSVCIAGGSSETVTDLDRPVSHVPTQPDLYHSTHWSHSPVLVTQQPAIIAPSVSATTGVIAMTTAQVERPASGGFTDGAYYSGYAKQRPLQEIVSSLQGSYNFLQESQIDHEGHSQNQSSSDVVYNNSYDNQNNSGQSLPTFSSQQTVLGSQSAVDQSASLHASQPHFVHDPTQAQPSQIFHSQGAPSGAYGVEGLHHNVYSHHQMAHEPGYDSNYGQMEKGHYNFMDQQAYVLTQMNPSSDAPSHVSNMNVASTAGPQPIPLPSQAIHGQSLTEQGQGFSGPQQGTDITEAMAKKQFTMNPNANIFRSVYDESSSAAGEQIKGDLPPTGAGDGQVLRTFAQTASANFQPGGANRGFGASFGSGGPVRGSGPSRGGRGGRDSTLNNGGVQSSARGGGPAGVSRGAIPNVGSNGQRGGGARGAPTRGGNSGMRGNDGRGYSRATNSQQSSHEQAAHA